MENSKIIQLYNVGTITPEDARQRLVNNGMEFGTAKFLTNGSHQKRLPRSVRKPIVELEVPTNDRTYWRQYAECRRKRRFQIQSHANKYRDELAERLGTEMKVYECRWCGCLHVAHAGTRAKV